MDNNLMNISKIETFFDNMLVGKVSENVFFTELPPTVESTWKNMVVVDCANVIENMNAYGRGIVNVFLYAKPSISGKKNVTELSKMETALTECVSTSNQNNYGVDIVGRYADYDSNRDLHCNIFQVQLKIT